MSQRLRYTRSFRSPGIESILLAPVIAEAARKINITSAAQVPESIFVASRKGSRLSHQNTAADLAEEAASYYSQGNWLEAIDRLRKLSRLRPSSPELYFLIGMAHLNRADLAGKSINFDELLLAANALEKTTKLDPNHAKAWFHLGTVYIAPFIATGDTSKLRRAIKPLNKALRLGHHVPAAHLYLAVAYEGLRNWEAAEEHYLKAIELDPSMVAPYLKLADLYGTLGGQNKAEREHYYRKAIEIGETLLGVRPDVLDAYNHIGMLYRHLGRHEDELTTFERAVEINNDDFLTLLNLGTAYLDAERYEEAKLIFQKIVGANPRTIAAYVARKFGDRDKADSFRADAYTGYGVACTGLHDGAGAADGELLDEAEGAFKQAVKLAPHNIEALFDLGVVYHRKNQLEGAEEVIRRVLEFDPDNQEAKKRIQLLLEERLKQRLLERELLRQIRQPITDFTPYQNRRPLIVRGGRVSETLLEDRR